MVGKMFKSVLCLSVLALAGTAFAEGPAVAHTKHSGVVVPTRANPPALKKIFSNLGPTATDNYNDATGYYVLGPTNSIGDPEQWIALPFTPKTGAHVTELQVAVGWISGTKRVVVGLYSDSAGTVGTLLASGASGN